jgi:hypothetical protein
MCSIYEGLQERKRCYLYANLYAFFFIDWSDIKMIVATRLIIKIRMRTGL